MSLPAYVPGGATRPQGRGVGAGASLAELGRVAYANGVSVRPEQLAQTLMKRHAARRARAEARAEDLRRRLEPEVDALVAEGVIRRAYLIGSLAWGGFHEASVVELVVEGMEERASPGIWARLGDALGIEVLLLCLESLDPGFASRVRARGVSLGAG
jgi:hypothetical protein